MSKLDKYEGCLVGGAIGDALGAPVEFWNDRQVLVHFPDGVRTFQPLGHGWPAGTVTDDTQMTLFCCEGILDAVPGGDVVPSVWQALLRWYRTQTYGPSTATDEPGRLLSVPALYVQRAPGTTCMGALAAGHTLDRGTCGGVMRSAPFGLQDKHPNKCYQDAADCAALTHGAPGGYEPAGALALIVRLVADGYDLDEACKLALKRLPTVGTTRRLLKLALQQAGGVTPLWKDMQRQVHLIGDGFDGPSALAIAVYAVAAGQRAGLDFTGIVSLAVSHGGDSDSTGAIAGNIAGAMLGARALPRKLAAAVEFGDVLAHYAERLAER